jgi:hypothetical protein
MGKKIMKKIILKTLSISTLDGGLWGDFTTIYWIYEYLDCSIHVWNKRND